VFLLFADISADLTCEKKSVPSFYRTTDFADTDITYFSHSMPRELQGRKLTQFKAQFCPVNSPST